MKQETLAQIASFERLAGFDSLSSLRITIDSADCLCLRLLPAIERTKFFVGNHRAQGPDPPVLVLPRGS